MLPSDHHPADGYSYGIDIGGTKMELVACDAELKVRLRRRVATPTGDYDAFVAALAGLVRGADTELGFNAGAGAANDRAGNPPLGLGVPGIVDAASGQHLAANIPCLTGRVLLPVLRPLLARPIALGNDCQCFSLSEAHGGAAAGYASMLGLIIGTGAGAGYVLGGQLVRGRNGVAGEWGHWPMGTDLLRRHELPAWRCACGGMACLECYVSGTGMRRLHAHAIGADLSAGADAETLLALRGAGDPAARRVLAQHLDLLGAAIARIVLTYDPHAIVLGGGLSRMPHLYAELAQAAMPHLLPGLAVPPILPPAFGDAGGARGAALLARQPNLIEKEC